MAGGGGNQPGLKRRCTTVNPNYDGGKQRRNIQEALE
jgi:hypothetical protein